MKKLLLISALLIIITGSAFYTNGPAPQSPEKLITDQLVAQVDSFSVSNNFLLAAARDRNADQQQLRTLFLKCRLAYKQFEWAAEYFNPKITRAVNGAPSLEGELSGFSRQPAGLQVIENCLYPAYDATKRQQIVYEAKSLIEKAAAYKSYYQKAVISEPQVWEAAKLEAFRILALGIAGFDCQLAQNSIKESAASLSSVSKVLASFAAGRDNAGLMQKFAGAEEYLKKTTDFDKFDRAEFIITFGNPLTEAIAAVQQHLNKPPVAAPQLLRQSITSLFATDAFDVEAFGSGIDGVKEEKIALGKKLFNDATLSGNMMRSCASCHQVNKGYADGLIKNTTIDGTALLKRNTPTLLNVAYQTAFFDDLREGTLESQAKSVIENKLEMHGSLTLICEKLSHDSTYTKLFAMAYPKSHETGIIPTKVTSALAAYVRTLSALNSRFDYYMRGEKSAMTAEEINGFNVFMGKAKCGTCHYMPLFNGVLPPLYNKMDPEVIGVPADSANTRLDDDAGRNGITHALADDRAFKTPTVRNANHTAPYMHNGVFNTLEQVIDFYDKGGGAGLGLKVPNQTLSAQKLNLSQKEKNDLVAFIKCLDNK